MRLSYKNQVPSHRIQENWNTQAIYIWCFTIYLSARYNVSTVNLQSHRDGCGTMFWVTHALICSIGSLVIAHNKKIRDELLYLSRRAFTSEYVRAKPLIHQGRTRSELEKRQVSDMHKKTRDEVTIQGLWSCQVGAIIDVEIDDADADTYRYEPMTSLLARWEKIKKDRHGKHCHDQWKYVLPFVFSVEWMIGREELIVLS